MTSAREFDLVLYGATGFVGALTAKYVAAAAPSGTKIAVAGRNEAKLRAVLAEIGGAAGQWPIIIADASSPASLKALATRTGVIITTVGPYLEYGLPLVQACAEAGTDYCDLTGEPQFVRESIDGFHKQAVDTGARIVHSCGFDSVPSDLAVDALYREITRLGQGELTETTLVVTAIRGGVSGGTAASGVAQMRAEAADPQIRANSANPYALSPEPADEPTSHPSEVVWRSGKSIDRSLRGWVATFFMNFHNAKLVRRSNALRGYAYGRDFRYVETMLVPGGPLAPIIAAGMAAGMAVGTKLGPFTVGKLPAGLADRILPGRGTGPSPKSQAKGHFMVQTFTTTTTGARFRAKFGGRGDPGYLATSRMLGESGLTLVATRGDAGATGGVLTPAVALGEALADRLRGAGFTITAERVG